MATEAVKLITGIGDTLLGRLVVYDALDMMYRFIPLRRAPERTAITDLVYYQEFCGLKRPVTDTVNVPLISAIEVKTLQDDGADFQLIDVRNIEEWNIVHIEGATLMPKNELLSTDGLARFDKDKLIVVQCKMGGRSKDALLEMQKHGFNNVKSLDGGVLAWVRDVDPSLPSY
jgi:adenylyltransferase/sulfurtransferase